MIYAVIIIIALAIAFIIVIRRLPEAMQKSDEGLSPEQVRPAAKPLLPRIDFSKLGLKRPGQSMTRKPFVFPKLPKFTLPKLKFPERSQKPNPLPPVATPTAPVASTTDFWADNKPKPMSEAETVVRPTVQPKKGKNLFQEAEDLFAIKDYRKAEKLYLKLATEDPQNTKIYSRLGLIYLEQQNYEDARDAFQQAIKLEPNVASRHYNLALTYTNLGSRAKAIQAMEQALKYDPSNRKYRKLLDEIRTS